MTGTAEDGPTLRRTAATSVRVADRASYDRALAHAILDEAMVAHVGFALDEQPFVVPMVYGRVGEMLYLHGAVGTRLARQLGNGIPVCVTVTLLDALVLAKSQFHHSVNYRSLLLLGTARRAAEAEARAALAAIVDHALPGRSTEARAPDRGELRRTAVLALPIDEASVKVRAHGPADDPDDLELKVWSGLLPIGTSVGPPEPDRLTGDTTPVPDSVRAAVARGVS